MVLNHTRCQYHFFDSAFTELIPIIQLTRKLKMLMQQWSGTERADFDNRLFYQNAP